MYIFYITTWESMKYSNAKRCWLQTCPTDPFVSVSTTYTSYTFSYKISQTSISINDPLLITWFNTL